MIYNIIGTIGVVIILSTYFLLQTNRIQADELRYSVLNFIGASMILISLYHDFNFPSFVVEVAWIFISIMGMFRWWRKQKRMPQS